jgi:hypothetical protein
MTNLTEPCAFDAFQLIAELCLERNEAPLTRYDGCWTLTLGEWQIAVNGHEEPRRYNRVAVAPFHAYIEFNGWPFALFHPYGDGWIGAGSYANLDKLETDLRAALAAARGETA